jgi:hypothetical protein
MGSFFSSTSGKAVPSAVLVYNICQLAQTRQEFIVVNPVTVPVARIPRIIDRDRYCHESRRKKQYISVV